MKDFPVNVFPDVKRDDFKKYTKKNVTEDYIKENLKRKGWECYKPFTDVGLDLVASKLVDGKRIYRFIQIKTRALVDGKFGYTLTPKDFITDPRKYYCLYCDTTDDVFLISTYDYLKMCTDHYQIGFGHFASPTFRTYNNKLNSLKYDQKTKKWSWSYNAKDGYPKGTVTFEKFLNDEGLANMEKTTFDDNLEDYLAKITQMKFDLFYKFNKTKSNEALFDGITETYIMKSLRNNVTRSNDDYIKTLTTIKNFFKRNYPELYESHLKYEKGGEDDE